MDKVIRKHEVYSVNDKLGSVDRIKNDKNQAKVAKELGISKSTLCGWKMMKINQEKRALHANDAALYKAVYNGLSRNVHRFLEQS